MTALESLRKTRFHIATESKKEGQVTMDWAKMEIPADDAHGIKYQYVTAMITGPGNTYLETRDNKYVYWISSSGSGTLYRLENKYKLPMPTEAKKLNRTEFSLAEDIMKAARDAGDKIEWKTMKSTGKQFIKANNPKPKDFKKVSVVEFVHFKGIYIQFDYENQTFVVKANLNQRKQLEAMSEEELAQVAIDLAASKNTTVANVSERGMWPYW